MSERGSISQVLNILLAVLLLVALAVTAYSIQQARSLQSEAKGKPTTDKGVNLRKLAKTAAMTVSPETVTAGEQYTISGTGLEADAVVSFSAATPGCCSSFVVATDASGAFSYTTTSARAGAYSVSAFQLASNGKLVKMAEVSFTVK